MPKISFPLNNQIWEPSYLGDYWGDFNYSFGINLFSDRSKILTTQPFVPHTTNQDISNLNSSPKDFAFFDAYYWAVLARVYKVDSGAFPTAKFAVDTDTNSPTDLSDPDIEIFGDSMIVSRPRDLAKRNAGNNVWLANWWTASTASGGLGQPQLNDSVHPLATFGKHLFIGDKNLLHSVDMGNNVYRNRLIFPSNATILWIKTTATRVFLGVKYTDGSFEVVEYDPLMENYKEWFVDEGEAVGFIWNNNLFILTERGNVYEWIGNGFRFFAKFPTENSSSSETRSNFILPHRNGITVINNIPHFLVMENRKIRGHFAGIYICDPEIKQIYHYRSVVFDPLNSYGTMRFRDVGGLFYVKNNNYVFAGVSPYTSGVNVRSGIYISYYSGTISYRSHIILPKIKTGAIDNIWKKVFIKYKLGEEYGAKIIVKYQTKEDEDNYPDDRLYGTWISSNQIRVFTTLANRWKVGDEIIILSGYGSGLITRITAINYPYITIEESVGVASTDLYFKVTNFRKMGEITDRTKNEQFLSFPENPLISDWIRLKLELRGSKTAVENVEIYYEPNERNL
jgi:hypothetical protein